ncbi:SGNH/GDSL hydrolase family protein [Streptomyces albireticuli]|uniref:G-D-S-L family lipolytic protein n=1 Tax=Streptomyces albireticuli TaxID=1940 RepID=A0A2A2DC62_9ACTN|nr:SGNH/GDSL hydrolase family protein [Streptomyces albireticuli]MCD9141239.1 SGNH/GDSL hydrolase family protein [Streptomyces albireticuli]MCD9160800.1 SGNH/GDSL hydrolase family protein [Streptomyces albireticuli]MCD9191143.1 SGNH/GDSL hydrolase family protein [Streptomyces albireticuli]PAU49071.1 G-D-S-L family lipolytic protein [Streptomyces albireticuli]
MTVQEKAPAAALRTEKRRTVEATTSWSAGWAAPVQRPSSGFEENWSEAGFARQSVRQVVRVTSGGTAARIRLSNRFGEQPLTVSAASLALAGGGAALRPGTAREVTFGGLASVTIPAGGEAVSDATELHAEPLDSVAVTLFFDGPTGPATFHAQAYATSYRAAGDRTSDAEGGGFDERTHSWYYLSDVELSGGEPLKGTVVAFGDSITDGFGSTVDADRRYPDVLAERLAATGERWAVLNAGIGGNLVLSDSPWYGERAVSRFERDVLDKPGVSSVIVFGGLNDIGFSEVDLETYKPNPDVTVEQLIAGYRSLIRRAHDRGVKVIGATILPFKGSEYHTPRAEAKRVALNEWIRTSGEYDAVADFADALASAEDPEVLAPAYDSGDVKHPNDAGYRIMAETVDPDSL